MCGDLISYPTDVSKEKKKKEEENEEKIGGRTSESSKSCRCACKLEVEYLFLYSTDTAFTQHNHDKYSLQTKGQKLADKEIFERHVRLQADPRRLHGACYSIKICIG